MKSIRALVVVLLIGWVATHADAQAPNLLNYQGRLGDSSGNPQNGTFAMHFAVYDAETGGNQLPSGTPWSETQSVTVTNGVFNVLLGSVTTLPANLFTGGPSDSVGPLRFLQVTVGGEMLSPRRRIVSAAYALSQATTVGQIDPALYGTGSDGTVTLATETTLTSNKNYANLTVNPGVTVHANGYKIFVTGTLTNHGVIERNGQPAAGTAGAAGLPDTTELGGSCDGGTGANGVVTVVPGGAGGPGAACQYTTGGGGGLGGNGASGTTSAGGSGGSAGATSTMPIVASLVDHPEALLTSRMRVAANFVFRGGSGGGGGASGGFGSSGTGGGSGGTGGGGGGGLVYLLYESLSNTGTISAAGGSAGVGVGGGGSSPNGSSGGGGGSGAGIVLIFARNIANTGAITANGGQGGNVAQRPGSTAPPGQPGQNGLVLRFNATTHAWE